MLKIFSVRDSKAEAYTNPFFLPAPGLAVREFQEACNNPETAIGRFPADYILFELGSFDPTTGEIVQHDIAKQLGHGIDFVQQTPVIDTE